MYRYLSVCSGIEAFSVAVSELDFQAAAFAEIEKFPSAVLAHRYPTVPNLGDMTAIDTDALGHIDWLVGGTPCQSFSVAGLREGLNDDRGNLTLEFVKLAHRLQDGNGLRGALWENVPGVLSDKTNAFGCLLGAIVGHDAPLETPRGDRWPDLGMVAGPRARCAWRILNSQYFGVPQRRRRVFLVADFGDGPDPAAVLFEPGSKGWRAEACGEAGEDVAGTISARTKGGGGLGTDMDLGGGLQAWPVQIAPTLNAHFGDKMGLENQHALGGAGLFVPVSIANSVTAHNGNRNEVSDMLNGHAVTVFSITPSNSNEDYKAREVDHSQALTRSGNKPSARGGDLIAFTSKDHGADAGPLSPTLRAGGHSGSHANGGVGPAIAFHSQASADQSMNPSETSPTMDKSKVVAMVSASAVRRLTPRECERLQGFPDDWTLIPGLSGWRDVGDDENPDDLTAQGLTVKRTKKGKLRVNDPDGPRYKALGNSFTTEPVNWIMSRAQASLRGERMPDWQPMRKWG